jgi:outer membrane immunogenic protein
MKSLALGLAALAALVAAPAEAADMAVKAPVYVAPAFSWTGCYVGVHGGGGWQASSFAGSGRVSDGGTPESGVGWLGGGQVGCNLQVRQFVIGLEGEFWGSTLYDREFFSDSFSTFEARSRNRWDGTLSVRAGVTFERAFIYGKLGVAWGKFDYTSDSSNIFGDTDSVRGNAIFTGVLIGVGFEYALTDNWTTKFEYNYIDYGNKVVNFTEVSCGGGGCSTDTFSSTVKEIKQIAKIGLNYKFDYGSAVVAKY